MLPPVIIIITTYISQSINLQQQQLYIKKKSTQLVSMSSQQQDRSELDSRAKQGETVVPGGTGGKSLEAQEHLAEGNNNI